MQNARKFLELAAQYNVLILEDNPYFELRYSGEDVPTIKSLDTEGRVIYVGSFSKILSPGIRVGFVMANRGIFSKLTVAKQVSDVHTNLMYQMIACDMLTKYDIDAHIAKVRDMYRAKRDAMCEAIEKYFRLLVPTSARTEDCSCGAACRTATMAWRFASFAGRAA